jgi:hypothetical protein
MIRSLFILFAATLYANSGYAQIAVALGGQAGVAFTSQSYTADPNSALQAERCSGLILTGQTDWGGAQAQVVLLDELSYIRKGSRTTYNFLGSSSTTELSLDYLQLTLAPKVRASQGRVQPFLFIGPTAAVLLSAYQNVSGSNSSTNIKSSLNTLEFGLRIGAGAEFEIPPRSYITAHASYGHGLSNVFDDRAFFGSNNEAYSREVWLTVGLLIDLAP